MKIQILSDLHLEFGPYTPAKTDADVIVLAGDIWTNRRAAKWAGETFNVPVVMVLGNHDFWGKNLDFEVERMRETAPDNVFILDDNAVQIDGVEFAGGTLWTDYALLGTRELSMLTAQMDMNDFKYISERSSYQKTTPASLFKKHRKAIDFLKNLPENDRRVVVSHHAPTGLSVAQKYIDRSDEGSPSYASNLSELMLNMSPKLWVHGHVHDSADYKVADTRVVCNPRGYHGKQVNNKFNEELLVEV